MFNLNNATKNIDFDTMKKTIESTVDTDKIRESVRAHRNHAVDVADKAKKTSANLVRKKMGYEPVQKKSALTNPWLITGVVTTVVGTLAALTSVTVLAVKRAERNKKDFIEWTRYRYENADNESLKTQLELYRIDAHSRNALEFKKYITERAKSRSLSSAEKYVVTSAVEKMNQK